jgi:peroxiredoxin
MQKLARIAALAIVMGVCLFSIAPCPGENSMPEQWSAKEGTELIGQQAPEFSGLKWLNTTPLTMQSLQGKVVLIRFWLIDCPFCSGSADALNQIYEKYRNKGVVVIGIHHPKSDAAHDSEAVLAGVKKLGFTFPIAQDNDWKTIRSFWLVKKRGYTSASLLIDKTGRIRWVHDGGTLPVDSPAYRSLDKEIQLLLGA